jgi:hypothetical protein
MGRVVLHTGNITWYFMTHGNIIQFAQGDGRSSLLLLLLLLLFIKLYYLTHWGGNKLRQNSSSLQLTAKAFESFHSPLYHPHRNINLFTVKWNENQNVIYVKLRTIKFPATVTNKRSHIYKGLVDDYKLRNKKHDKFLFYNLFLNLVTNKKRNMCDIGTGTLL